jgi:hypothetical protein
VANVEYHAGEFFPRLGFIGTNLETPSRAVVRFSPHDGFVAGPPQRARQQFLDVPQQIVVRRKPNRISDFPFFERLVITSGGRRSSGSRRGSRP